MSVFSQLKRCHEFFLDLIFPKVCISCQKEGYYLCPKCLSQISLNTESYCVLCRRKTEDCQICPSCKMDSNLQNVFVASDYNNEILQRLIHDLKYNYILELGEVLSNLLTRYLEENFILQRMGLKAEDIILVPVPLHKKRYLARGFNQSDCLAEGIGRFYQMDKLNLLSRKRNTRSQIDLKRNERQQNVKDAFTFIKPEELDINKKIILIDDVVTTGSTLNECAKALTDAGFIKIYGLVLAQRGD